VVAVVAVVGGSGGSGLLKVKSVSVALLQHRRLKFKY